MKRSFCFTAVLFCLIFISGPGCTSVFAQKQLTPKKEADIRRLLDLTGSLKMADQMAQSMTGIMISALSQKRPDVPAEALKIMRDEINSAFSESLNGKSGPVDQIVALYGKYFTDSEINQLAAFYQTKLGQKMLSTMPELANESMLIGLNWGRSLVPEIKQRIAKKFKEKGIKLDPEDFLPGD